jgi:hypothetical protein
VRRRAVSSIVVDPRVRSWLGPALPATLAGAFVRETAETTRRRALALLPLMGVVDLLHVAAYATTGTARAALDPRVLRWQDAIARTHAVTFLVATAFFLFVLAGRRRPAPGFLAPLLSAVYLLVGAALAGIDQLQMPSLTAYIECALGVAVIFPLRPRAALVLYPVAFAAFAAALVEMQPSASMRLSMVSNGATMTAVSLVLALLLEGGRRRDFVQRVTIDEQRDALAQLNAGLEVRIAEQVSETVRRSDEVSRLNAQLTAQVRARSAELSVALAKLAQQRDAQGVLAKGMVLGDRFEVLGALGEGGMGAVYAGLDRTTGQRVAIKVVQAASSQELDALHRFLREAASAASVTHPAVVRMLHVDVSDDGMLFQVQELVEGVTLQHRVRGGHRWDPGAAARVVGVLSEALAAAHARGVVHRDVKPANVMLTREPPGLKLVDFGIAKLYEQALAGDAGTRTGAILGTPAFMAPEQIDGGSEVNDRSDVYSVGVILFLLLTGSYPFGDATPRRMLLNHVLLRPPDVRDLEPAVPAGMAQIAARCLLKEPPERPPAEEIARLLRSLAEAQGTPPLQELEAAGMLRDADAVATETEPTAITGRHVSASPPRGADRERAR